MMSADLATPSHADRTMTLMLLFPGDERSHLCWEGTTSTGKKRTVTRHSGATASDFNRHLDPASERGPGAIGVKLAYQSESGAWSCRCLALDLDELTVDDVRSTGIVDTLEGLGISPYFTTGSTGRGCHMYLFIDAEVPLDHAREGLRALTFLVLEAAPGTRVETFPSSGRSGGKGLFLPYRGAGLDGFGANPLLDAVNDWARVPLDGARTLIKRTPRDCIFRLAQRARPTEPSLPARSTDTLTSALTSSQQFEAEATRLMPLWRVGMRNPLVVGLTAYAVSGLGLDSSTIIAAIRRLHRASGVYDESPQADEALLLNAAHRVIERHLSGQLVAWYSYYEQANVAPPPPVGKSSELLQRIDLVGARPAGLTFSGPTALTDRALLEALVDLAKSFGRLHPDGVNVRVSQRHLAREANLSDNGAKAALKRLRERNLVRTLKNPTFGEPGSIVLLTDLEEANQRPQSSSTKPRDKAIPDWVRCLDHTAYRRSGLGQLAGLIVCELRKAPDNSITRSELSSRLNRKPWRLTGAIARLEQSGIITVEPPDLLSLAHNAVDKLNAAADRTGVTRRRVRQKERHEAEQAAFRRVLAKKRRRHPNGLAPQQR